MRQRIDDVTAALAPLRLSGDEPEAAVRGDA